MNHRATDVCLDQFWWDFVRDVLTKWLTQILTWLLQRNERGEVIGYLVGISNKISLTPQTG